VRYRILGNTGLRVSVIGVGTWQLGGEWGRDFTQAEADAILDEAAAQEINLIDTAECYGDHVSERLIGDYLSRRDRSRWIVATKFGHQFTGFLRRNDDFSAAGAVQQLEASLKALRVDAVDLFQFHSGPDDAFLREDLWQALAREQRAGKVRHLGVSISNKGSELQAREAARMGASVLQVVYNRLDRRAEQHYFPHATAGNLGVLARVPLASGLLAGKYRAGSTFSSTDFRSTMGAERIERDLAEVERLRATEVPEGVPMGQWALAWCLKNPAVTSVIPGCKSAGQVRDNAKAAECRF
jgi:aryl-alcohol dehydrogenase-like predicted oxidoreductase